MTAERIAKTDKIVITGAAGLVGQNLVLMLSQQGYQHIVAIDKHHKNLQLLKKLNPAVQTVEADLTGEGDWQQSFAEAKVAIVLHAQITGLNAQEFVANNLTATEHVITALKQYHVPYTVHVSSSVVVSVTNDDYTNTKKQQEKLMLDSSLNCCVLRPTLMFGWFDPKHLGWLARFMEKTPVFPIPGDGKYLRQPLFSQDFCRVIIAAMQQQPSREIFDIVGQEEIDYIDMIRLIKKIKKLSTIILKIPYGVFQFLLKCYALFSKKPPFTADQLTALTAGDYFKGVDIEKQFSVQPTPLAKAFEITYTDPNYSHIIVER